MEFGTVIRIRDRPTVVVYPSERRPGFVYKFMRKKDTEYVCCRCKQLKKCRSIRVVNDTVVGRKHPEDDHHPDCQPLPQSVTLALEADRDVRQNVRLKSVPERRTPTTQRKRSSHQTNRYSMHKSNITNVAGFKHQLCIRQLYWC